MRVSGFWMANIGTEEDILEGRRIFCWDKQEIESGVKLLIWERKYQCFYVVVDEGVDISSRWFLMLLTLLFYKLRELGFKVSTL